MKEIIEDTEYDDEYEPVEMVKSEGYRNGVPTTFYTITVEADFDEDFKEILEEFDLDISGYNLETIILAYLEQEQAELLEHIVSFDTERTTFVCYTDTAENQHTLAALIQKLCISKKTFKKIVQDNLVEIQTKYS